MSDSISHKYYCASVANVYKCEVHVVFFHCIQKISHALKYSDRIIVNVNLSSCANLVYILKFGLCVVLTFKPNRRKILHIYR